MKWAVLILISLVAGCAVSRKPVATTDLPFQVPNEWTASLDENQAPVQPALDWGSTNLVQLIEAALQNNHDLRQVLARVQAAAAQRGIATADLFPSLDFQFDARKQQQNFVGLPIPGAGRQVLTSRSTQYTVSFNTLWELDLWGRVRAGRRAAGAEFQAAREEYQAAQLSLVGQVAKTFYAATEASLQLKLAEETLANYEATAEQVRDRYQRGIRSPLDLRLALNSSAGARALAAQREQEVQVVLRQLELLAGRYPAGTLEEDAELPALDQELPAGLPSELLRRRPDLRAAEERLGAAGARVKEARASFFPRISLTASGGRSSSELQDLLSSQFNVWALAGNFAQPLLEGGRLWSNLRLSKARLEEALQIYYGQVLLAFQEVETRLASANTLQRREEELKEAALQAAAAARLAEQRYRSGLEEFITVLEAQRRELEAQSQLLLVRRLRLENQVELYLALGGATPEPKWQAAAQEPLTP